MTKAQFYTLVAEQVRLNAVDPTEQNRILMWGDLVSDRMAKNWFWDDLSHDISITVVEGQRTYPFSAITSDIDSIPIIVGKEDKDSFRQSGRGMVYRPLKILDDRDPGWRISSNTGSSEVFTFQRRKLVLEKVPDSDFAGTGLHGRISAVPQHPSDAAVASSLLEDQTPGWERDMQELLVQGTVAWGARRQGASDWLQLFRLWQDEVDEYHAMDDSFSDYDSIQNLPISLQGFE